MTDDEIPPLPYEITHLNQRLNQALGEAIEYEQTGRDQPRFVALAELEAVQDEITEIIEDHAEEAKGGFDS